MLPAGHVGSARVPAQPALPAGPRRAEQAVLPKSLWGQPLLWVPRGLADTSDSVSLLPTPLSQESALCLTFLLL